VVPEHRDLIEEAAEYMVKNPPSFVTSDSEEKEDD